MAAVIFSPPRHWKKRGGLLLAFANGTLKGLFLIIMGRASPYLIVLGGMKRCGQGGRRTTMGRAAGPTATLEWIYLHFFEYTYAGLGAASKRTTHTDARNPLRAFI